MKEPRIRKGTLTKEYYLLAKDGDSILYNGWYTRNELVALDECKISRSGLILRMEKIGGKYQDLWSAVIDEKHNIANNRKPKPKPKKKPKVIQHSLGFYGFVNIMKTMPVGSCHKEVI